VNKNKGDLARENRSNLKYCLIKSGGIYYPNAIKS
jgi:hypothetical protein